MIQIPQQPLVILRLNQLIPKLGLSRAAIYDRLNPHSTRYDATFPKRISLGGRAVGFIEFEVHAWLQAQIELSRRAKGGPNV
jgi:prophage regulatory protein